jgi:hypothetical protein
MRTHWEPPKKIQQGVYHQMDLSGLGIDIKLKEKKRKSHCGLTIYIQKVS